MHLVLRLNVRSFVLLCASLVRLDVPQCVLRCILVCFGHQTLGSCKLGAIVSATWKCATTTHCICHLLKLPSPPRLTFPYDLLLLLPTHPLAFPPSHSYPLTFSSLGLSSFSFTSSSCSVLSAHPPPSPPISSSPLLLHSAPGFILLLVFPILKSQQTILGFSK